MQTSHAVLAAAFLLAAPLGCASEPVEPSTNVEAVAMLASEAPPPPEGVGVLVDPSALVVFVGNGTATCAAPFLPPWHAGKDCLGPDRSAWQVAVAIPPAHQQPGTFSLEDGAVASEVTTQWIEGDTCAGGGSSVGGAMDVLGIDDASVVVRFHDMPAGNDGGPADGHLLLEGRTVTAARCP